MLWFSFSALCLLLASTSLGQGGFPPPLAEDVITVAVPAHPGVSISYRETHICEEQSKAWAGYVHMPSTYLRDVEGDGPYSYNVSMFFWFFEARVDPQEAPTAIYLAGGPGQSSMFGAASDGGPCYVGADSNSTYNNEWSMNTYVNMLYVDQPVGAGFSYDTLVNSTFDALFLAPEAINDTGIVPFEAYNGAVPTANATFLYGTLPSQDPLHTANTTALAARTLWHFSQAWFSAFPEWKTCKKEVTIWGNSYAGYWIPPTAAYFKAQNTKISLGEVNNSIIIDTDTIGFTNGCIDILYQSEWYPVMAYNNTYDLQVINETEYEAALNANNMTGGCLDLIEECRALGREYDSEQLAINETVNGVCANATVFCATYVLGAYNAASNRSVFDMGHMNPDPFPLYYLAGYFNQEWVQKELGVPVNFTQSSNLNTNVVTLLAGDAVKVEGMKSIEYLSASGVKIALVYGDRDYRCPWLGVERLSLQANWTGAEVFRNAGYEDIHTNGSYSGGVVRQHGNLSFSRVFDAGHDASAYQPETVFQIFNRAVSGRDVATGLLATNGRFNNYTTGGPSSSFQIKNSLPPIPDPICHLYDVAALCTVEQYEALKNGTAVIENFVVTSPAGPGAPLTGNT